MLTVSAACWLCLFFFFSSRRRHTRLQGDWSSDVCSSDLNTALKGCAALVSILTFPECAFDTSAAQPFSAVFEQAGVQLCRGLAAAWEQEIGRASCRERV